jgi:hypothetical protein
MSKPGDYTNLDRMSNHPAKPGLSFIEQLMSHSDRHEPTPIGVEVREAVYNAVQSLSEDHRIAIEARYFYGKSFSDMARELGFSSKSSAYDKLQDAEEALRQLLLESRDVRFFLGENMNTWNEAARFELDRISTSLKAGYKFDGDLFSDYGRMMGEATRSGDESVIVVFAWYTAIEAARCLDSMGLWDADELEYILVSKQHDYGHDNINAFGQIGVAVRLSDKIARYYNLVRRDREAKNEPFMDCLKDMVGYGVISAMLGIGTFDYQLKEDAS